MARGKRRSAADVAVFFAERRAGASVKAAAAKCGMTKKSGQANSQAYAWARRADEIGIDEAERELVEAAEGTPDRLTEPTAAHPARAAQVRRAGHAADRPVEPATPGRQGAPVPPAPFVDGPSDVLCDACEAEGIDACGGACPGARWDRFVTRLRYYAAQPSPGDEVIRAAGGGLVKRDEVERWGGDGITDMQRGADTAAARMARAWLEGRGEASATIAEARARALAQGDRRGGELAEMAAGWVQAGPLAFGQQVSDETAGAGYIRRGFGMPDDLESAG